MKKLFTIMLAMVMLFAITAFIVGCGNDELVVETPTPTPTAEPTPTPTPTLEIEVEDEVDEPEIEDYTDYTEQLVGRWTLDGSTFIILDSDGTFVWGPVEGHWGLVRNDMGNHIIALHIDDPSFDPDEQWHDGFTLIEFIDENTIYVDGGGLTTPTTLYRAEAEPEIEPLPDNLTADDIKELLIGEWGVREVNPIMFVFRDDGTLSIPNMEGYWDLNDNLDWILMGDSVDRLLPLFQFEFIDSNTLEIDDVVVLNRHS